VSNAFRTARASHELAYRWLERVINKRQGMTCLGIDNTTIARWIDAAAANPVMRSAPRRQEIAALRGQIALKEGRLAAARKEFDAALVAWPTPDTAAKQAAQLASHGAFKLALGHLDAYERLRASRKRPTAFGMPAVHDTVLEHQGYWDRELARLRAVIAADAAGSVIQ
jgi:hypothetical protein